MSYNDLSDEDKLNQAIQFVAVEQPLPPVLEQFLREQMLYELIVNRRMDVQLTVSQPTTADTRHAQAHRKDVPSGRTSAERNDDRRANV